MNLRLALVACSVALLGTTVATRAQSEPITAGTYSFRTELTDAHDLRVGADEGVLTLTVARNGTLGGFYRASGTSRIETVTGGLEGDAIWMDVGFDRLHVEGTFVKGRIDGITPLTREGEEYRFEAFAQSKQI